MSGEPSLAARARALARRLRYRAALEWDLRRFSARHAGTLAAPPGGDRIALVVSLSEWVYQLKLEGLLLRALAEQGYTAVAVVPQASSWARRYFRVFGIERFVELSDYLDPELEGRAKEEARTLSVEAPSLGSMKALTYRGAAIGRQVLSSVSRTLHEGAIDFADPRVRELVNEVLPVAVRSTLAAERLLDDVRPELVLFNERNYAEQGPLSDLALGRGLNVIQFVSAFQDDALVFKRYTSETRGLHPRSLSDESWAAVRELEWTEGEDSELEEDFRLRYDNAWFMSRRVQGWTRKYEPAEIVARLGLDPAKKTAVVFSHVLWDANMFYGEDLFADQEEWFVETVRAACGNDRINWIVKLHPANVWKLRRDAVAEELDEIGALRDRIGELPAHVAVLRPESDVSTWSIFRLAAAGVTIRGSVGIELPCFGVPVLTAGTGFYSGRGFTSDSSSPGEYLERLRTIESVEPLSPEQVLLARKHAYAIFRLRPTRFTSFRTVFRPPAAAGHPLDHDLELLVRSRGELEAAPDLRRFADWAVSSRALDYLEPLPERAPPAYAESRAS